MLTERDITRITKAWGKLPHEEREYPQYLGGNNNDYSLQELIDLVDSCEYNQVFNPNKARDVLIKSHTGLINTGFYLLEAVTVGYFEGNFIVTSGRHRIAALNALFDLLGINKNEIVPVNLVRFPSLELLGKSIEAANTTRSMTPTERERIRLSVKNGGELPNIHTVTKFTRSKSGMKRVFKQIMLNAILETEHPEELLTEHNMGRLLGTLYEWLMKYRNPENELFNVLKQGDIELWAALELMIGSAADAGCFDQPPSGNISRALHTLSDGLIEYCDEFLTDAQEEDEQDEFITGDNEWESEAETTHEDGE